MSVYIIWEEADGSVVKGLDECDTPSADTKKFVDTDLNHGSVSAGSFTVPKAVSIRSFSWVRNGDPAQPITDAKLYLDPYYSNDATYTAPSGKTFCGGAGTAVFGDYSDAGGSATPNSDYSNLISWGDDDFGLQVSLDRGRTYTTIKTGVGDTIGNGIDLAATAMDIGSVDGQLEPGDRALLYLRIGIPSTFNDPNNQGILLFGLGLTFNYTE